MGNVCFFSMGIKGQKENIDKLLRMLKQEGITWIGRGAEFEISECFCSDYYTNEHYCRINGSVSNSLHSALFANAESMRSHPEKWNFTPEEIEALHILTLAEACQELDLNIECYSEEPACCFSEHLTISRGEVLSYDKVDHIESYDETTGEWTSEGGFPNWDFNLLLNGFDSQYER